jgi:hypothetical protein
MNRPQNWLAVTESQYPWERDALAFVRQQFPTHEPYRAWANFDFVMGHSRAQRKKVVDSHTPL